MPQLFTQPAVVMVVTNMRYGREKRNSLKVMNGVLPSFVDPLSGSNIFAEESLKKNKQRFRRKTGREEAAARSQMVAMS